jgi:hypothetical protein
MRSPRPKGGRGPLIPGARTASRPTRLGMRPAQRPPRLAGTSRYEDPGPPDSNGYPVWAIPAAGRGADRARSGTSGASRAPAPTTRAASSNVASASSTLTPSSSSSSPERATKLGGVVEQARPRVRLPRQALQHALPGRQAHMRDGRRAAEISQIARDQHDRMALEHAAEHHHVAARFLNRRHAPLRPLIRADSLPRRVDRVAFRRVWVRRLAVKTPGELGALALGQAAECLAGRDPAAVQDLGGLHPAVLGEREQHVEHLCRLKVRGRVEQQRAD